MRKIAQRGGVDHIGYGLYRFTDIPVTDLDHYMEAVLDTTADDLAACILLVQQIAQRAKDRLEADGVNLLNCSGEAVRQTVFHFHIHIILRFKDESGKDRIGLPWDTAASNLDEITRIGNLLS